MGRFIRRGVSKFYWLPAVANIAAPSAAEITAGYEITGKLAEINGFDFTNERAPAPDFAARFTSSIPGANTIGDSSIVVYEDDTNQDVEDALPMDDTGYLLIAPKGRGVTKPGEVYPATITGINREYTADNTPARITIGFAITAEPELDAALPS